MAKKERGQAYLFAFFSPSFAEDAPPSSAHPMRFKHLD